MKKNQFYIKILRLILLQLKKQCIPVDLELPLQKKQKPSTRIILYPFLHRKWIIFFETFNKKILPHMSITKHSGTA